MTGKRPRDADDGNDPYDPGIGGDPGTGVGSGTGGTGGENGGAGEQPLETPCVGASPEGVELEEINQKALQIANVMQSLNVEAWGYGALIYIHNGTIYSTAIFTQQNPYQVAPSLIAIDSIPNGANIVAFIHNHTSIGASSDNGSIPSPDDYRFFAELRQYLANNNPEKALSVDRNALLYIHGKTNVTNETNRTRLYDRRDEDRNDPEYALQ